MKHWNFAETVEAWSWDRSRLEDWQLSELNRQFARILPLNRFYQDKLGCDRIQLNALSDLSRLPLTTKDELIHALDESGFSRHQTFELNEYSRLHRTSGTKGKPLMILDTEEDWQWWSATWQHVLAAADIDRADRVFLAFSFGPFIGFWSAHEACSQRGALVIPGGGLHSLARLELMRDARATVLACTPSYALHLQEVATAGGIDLRELGIRRVLVAGEPGGSIPAVRERIEESWGAKVVDHCGATEIGPWGFGWPEGGGIHVIETSFIAELIPFQSAGNASEKIAELVLTSLGRIGAPVIRYRTGDLVRVGREASGRCQFMWLKGGVIGRADDMLIVRGVNVFPSSIESILREFKDLQEYRVILWRSSHLDEITIEVEAPDEKLQAIKNQLLTGLGLRVDVIAVASGSLPRTEGKSRRWLDKRTL